MADYNNISESHDPPPPPPLLPSSPFPLCTFVTHTQSLNMSLEKSFLRRKYFVAACLESSSILARHPKPAQPSRAGSAAAAAAGRDAGRSQRQAAKGACLSFMRGTLPGRHTKPARSPCLIYAGWILKFQLLLHFLLYLLLRLFTLSSTSNNNRKVQRLKYTAL